MSLTAAQQRAVAARGDVVVVAGAGTGKTRTLVERCLACLLEEKPPVSLEEVLMVTFTEAAAAEMRQRIRARLEEESRRQPAELRWHEQLALFETAHIGTLHSFCLKLVQQHFYELALDPQLSVLAEEEARMLAEETLGKVLEQHYAGQTSQSEGVLRLIQIQAGGWDKPVRSLVLRLHHYTQTLPDPAGWFTDQLAMYAQAKPVQWREWLIEALADWRAHWLPRLQKQFAGNEIAAACTTALEQLERSGLSTPSDSPKAHELGAERGHPCPQQHPSRGQGDESGAHDHSEAVADRDVRAPLNRQAELRSSPAISKATWERILQAEAACPKGKKTAWVKPLKEFFAEAQFLSSLAQSDGEADPLAEDWDWVRGQMTTLLGLAREFGEAFTEAKRELGMVDFHDLEQYSLRLLWDAASNQPTPIARQWREKLRFIFVDEYQDINAAQDKIIEAISRQGAQANRFLVGDVKQSIYRFRLANPYIFQGYVERWGDASAPAPGSADSPAGDLVSGAAGDTPAAKLDGRSQAIPLVENFRSREGLLDFINSFFGLVVRRELGGVAYDDLARLIFGAAEERKQLSAAAVKAEPRVELMLRLKGNLRTPADGMSSSSSFSSSSSKGRGRKISEDEDENEDEEERAGAMAEAEKEARLVALRLSELKAGGHLVWDENRQDFRPMEWSDAAILLRSPSAKSESYAKEFSKLGVPLRVERGGFYESLEVSDLLCLLQVLDNPLQDLPALAVLHSPLVGLTLDELATIRLAGKGPFWRALVGWTESTVLSPQSTVLSPESKVEGLKSKVERFLERFARWRRMARQVSLGRCLEAILAETDYSAWLLTQPRGAQRHANVQRLLGLAQQFDRFQRHGLFRFLGFVEAQKQAETEPEVAPVGEENAARLMSIHQSKGLEFPVVVVADLAKPFNISDQHADIILDEHYGLCPQVKARQTGARYPSLPHWLSRRRQRREMLGEELRLLYVALTRARDTLILCASVAPGALEKKWRRAIEATDQSIDLARSCADWLGLWFSRRFCPEGAAANQGADALVRWCIHDESSLVVPACEEAGGVSESFLEAEPGVCEALQKRLDWRYSYGFATTQTAKIRVSEFARQFAQFADEDAALVFPAQRSTFNVQRSTFNVQGSKFGATPAPPSSREHLSAADIGIAHHLFLQFVSLECVGSKEGLETEAQRLLREGILSPAQVEELDFEALWAFWKSEIGRKVRAQARYVRREMPFTIRFDASELASLGAPVLRSTTAEGGPASSPARSEQSIAAGEDAGAPREALAGEFVVAEGKADLVVLRPGEIWLLDFKTDKVKGADLDARVKLYEPQLRLYARALSAIYGRPVSECWLYFLEARRAVAVRGDW
jgi:ATP-dependent helicase/nuclease subunit A